MNAADFVDAVRTEVRDAATEGSMSLLGRPPGRRPDPELVRLSQWFNALPEIDKGRVREVAALASHQATFGILAVLDGVRVIESGPDRGALELWYVKGTRSTLLNDPNGPLLHELMQEM